MSDTNVQWQPVEAGWDDADDDSPSSIGWDGLTIAIMRDGELAWHKPPPDIRLCRATPVEWSRETPTVDGLYWYCGPLSIIDGGTVINQAYLHEPDAVRVRNGHVRYDGWSWSLSQCTGWWTPATVPTPPEVGP